MKTRTMVAQENAVADDVDGAVEDVLVENELVREQCVPFEGPMDSPVSCVSLLTHCGAVADSPVS